MTSLLSPEPAMASAPRAAGRGAIASFARFVIFGGGLGLASSAAVPLLAALMPWAVANALITVASTVLGTELHARFTFGTGRFAGWRQHIQSASSAGAAYLVTSAAILILHVVQPAAGTLREQVVYIAASGLAGIGRFLVLRLFVFARGGTPAADVRRACEGPTKARSTAGRAPRRQRAHSGPRSASLSTGHAPQYSGKRHETLALIKPQ
ncbi:GtrA family protein [Phytohabitans aurantiacus]|uniref:GtrA-like protein domain-containing protein n=1 Tax=Phytohabitans aurantiacus TaxID=3016789 RepID=A0ABQ5QZP8_9ACTN|nr:hypothetical protein [Phytohabitans aurantiacus]GLH99387.1 hypothetical protein Pa4123_46630 [Phytohabitans aurantiacus]